MTASYAFGPFVLIPERQTLLLGDEPVRVGGRAIEILAALVARPGDVISKRQLIEQVWPDTVVDDGNLKVNIAALRRALDDGAVPNRYIATVTGRGYRFVAPVQASGEPAPATALEARPTATTARSNLPTRTTRVFGRTDAVEALRGELERTRLLSIVGAGGIGKTTVAIAVAEQWLGSMKDGVWFIDLAPLGEAAMLPNVVATALGLPAHSAQMLTPLCEFLRDREMLLLIDNCEHVIDAAASLVSRVLAEAAAVKILVTSREPLLVKGERVRRLPGLAAPPSAAGLKAHECLAYPAVQLFVTRARERLDAFELSDSDAPMVAEICHRLDGLALAIEFAATRIDAFSVRGLLNQLDDRFRLQLGRRAGPERQRTLLATLEWSYSLLSDEEAALLRAVSVFAGLFEGVGAAAVGGLSNGDAVEGLAQLAAKSLLATDLEGANVAYRLLETTRSFCVERLRASGREHEVRQRHAEYICATLERAAGEWAQRPADEWANAYGRSIDDLRVALSWTGRDEINRTMRIRLTVAGLLLWNHFSLTEESRGHVSRAADEVEATGLAGTVFDMKLKLWLGGATMFTRGFKSQAMAASRRALEIAIEIGDTEYHLRGLMMIGIYELFAGEHEAGLRTLERFSAVAGRHDPSTLPEAEVHTGIAELFLGRIRSARQRLENLQARDLRYFGSYVIRYLSDPVMLARSVLTQVQWLLGQPDTARRAVEAALAGASELDHHLSLNNVLSYACPVYYWSGDYEACGRCVAMLEEHVARHRLVARRPVARFFRAALMLVGEQAEEKVGDQLRQREPLALAVPEDSLVDPVDAMKQAIDEFREINHLARMPYYLSVLAQALGDRGRFGEAEETIRLALETAQAQHEGWCLPEVIRVQAALMAAQGQRGTAEVLLGHSMALSQASGARSWRLRAAYALAKLQAEDARAEDALRVLLPVFNEFSEGFSTKDLLAAASLLGSLSGTVPHPSLPGGRAIPVPRIA